MLSKDDNQKLRDPSRPNHTENFKIKKENVDDDENNQNQNKNFVIKKVTFYVECLFKFRGHENGPISIAQFLMV